MPPLPLPHFLVWSLPARAIMDGTRGSQPDCKQAGIQQPPVVHVQHLQCATSCLLDFSSTTNVPMHGIYTWLLWLSPTNTQTYWNADLRFYFR